MEPLGRFRHVCCLGHRSNRSDSGDSGAQDFIQIIFTNATNRDDGECTGLHGIAEKSCSAGRERLSIVLFAPVLSCRVEDGTKAEVVHRKTLRCLHLSDVVCRPTNENCITENSAGFPRTAVRLSEMHS